MPAFFASSFKVISFINPSRFQCLSFINPSRFRCVFYERMIGTTGISSYVRQVTMIWSVCKWCRKRFTRSDNGLCRQNAECFNEVAFVCCNEDIPETAGTIIASANATSRIIAKDGLLILWSSSQ
jgi:hypothetical protein